MNVFCDWEEGEKIRPSKLSEAGVAGEELTVGMANNSPLLCPRVGLLRAGGRAAVGD